MQLPTPTPAMGASVEEPGVACGTCVEEASAEEVEECGICKEALCASTAAALDGCRHRFCGPCILRWASVESTCPFCKSRFKSVRLPEGSPSKGKGKNIAIPERNQSKATEDGEGGWDAWENLVCMECGGGDEDELMLLCDRCDAAAHTFCVGLGRAVPEGDWFCRECTERTAERDRHAPLRDAPIPRPAPPPPRAPREAPAPARRARLVRADGQARGPPPARTVFGRRRAGRASRNRARRVVEEEAEDPFVLSDEPAHVSVQRIREQWAEVRKRPERAEGGAPGTMGGSGGSAARPAGASGRTAASSAEAEAWAVMERLRGQQARRPADAAGERPRKLSRHFGPSAARPAAAARPRGSPQQRGGVPSTSGEAPRRAFPGAAAAVRSPPAAYRPQGPPGSGRRPEPPPPVNRALEEVVVRQRRKRYGDLILRRVKDVLHLSYGRRDAALTKQRFKELAQAVTEEARARYLQDCVEIDPGLLPATVDAFIRQQCAAGVQAKPPEQRSRYF